MTTLGQFVGFAGRSLASVIDGDGSPENPWKFEYQSKNGGCSEVTVEEDTGFYYEYVPILAAGVPPPFNPGGGDLVAFRPCEAKFQQFPGPYTEGTEISTWLLLGWVTFTMHFDGAVYPDATPYAILSDPRDAGCYVLCIASEITKLA